VPGSDGFSGGAAYRNRTDDLRITSVFPCPRANRTLIARTTGNLAGTSKAQVRKPLPDLGPSWLERVTLERVTGIEPALSAWEAERCELRTGLTCAARCPPLTVRDRWLPGLITLMARTRGAGFPRAGARKILPRPRRTVGVKKRGDRSHTRGARGREPPLGPLSRCSSPWCSSSAALARTRHTSPGGSSSRRRPPSG
jgi:hypothetical protein